MNLGQIINNQPVPLGQMVSYDDTNASAETVRLWTDEERAAWGIYPVQDDPIPDGKVATGSTLTWDGASVRREWTLQDAPPPPAPQSITPAQAKAQLYEMGLLDDAEALVASHPYALVRIYWNSALQFDRDNAYIAALAFELGIDDQLDDLFRAASQRTF